MMNFKLLIDELVESGMSQAAIATQVGIKPPSLFAIRAGQVRDVRFKTGVRLIELYNSRFPERTIALFKSPVSTN